MKLAKGERAQHDNSGEGEDGAVDIHDRHSLVI